MMRKLLRIIWHTLRLWTSWRDFRRGPERAWLSARFNLAGATEGRVRQTAKGPRKNNFTHCGLTIPIESGSFQ